MDGSRPDPPSGAREDWLWHQAQQRWLYAPRPHLSDLTSDTATYPVLVTALATLTGLAVVVLLLLV